MVPTLVRRALGGVAALAAAGALVAVPATTSGAATTPPTNVQHCVVNIGGANAVSPMRCYATLDQANADGATYSSAFAPKSGALTALSGDVWEATHFDGLGFTGSSLTVYGTSTCSGWLNMNPFWNNRISSTLSDCTSWHFDGINLNGAVESINAPGGDLIFLDNKPSSIQYT
jgi:hypothetical protein